ncbi:hypothetical protein GVO57_03705 [Sphingomonas changnyeongensis]|uniref:Uncharacterized protein n=1 Tax=Sphingomonas changnyeongensis TaxID=2698679 RepID=A0A7Z2NVC3_9SPHN|nr:hypothetical protein [Sphingomonas changnyeongensis]QHL90099.1 hypothetical protein GVO57_03705 [Sphingomonas changnyeongensis]
MSGLRLMGNMAMAGVIILAGPSAYGELARMFPALRRLSLPAMPDLGAPHWVMLGMAAIGLLLLVKGGGSQHRA